MLQSEDLNWFFFEKITGLEPRIEKLGKSSKIWKGVYNSENIGAGYGSNDFSSAVYEQRQPCYRISSAISIILFQANWIVRQRNDFTCFSLHQSTQILFRNRRLQSKFGVDRRTVISTGGTNAIGKSEKFIQFMQDFIAFSDMNDFIVFFSVLHYYLLFVLIKTFFVLILLLFSHFNAFCVLLFFFGSSFRFFLMFSTLAFN